MGGRRIGLKMQAEELLALLCGVADRCNVLRILTEAREVTKVIQITKLYIRFRTAAHA
jgi:hypothetical protein